MIRPRLAQVFEKEDYSEPMDAVVRRFWSRGPRGAQEHRRAGELQTPVESRLVDLASWARARGARVAR